MATYGKSSALVLLLLVPMMITLTLLQMMITRSQAQVLSCSSQLSNLNVCVPHVLPGAAGPTNECCSALQSVQGDCLCNTLRIASRLPSACGLPPMSCVN
ncbi:Guanine nucleotide-binding protein alpha-3 subunit [Dionaea muscipula]